MNLNQCFLTANSCYKAGVRMKPVGVMVHSTGANNPNLWRYVQPDDGKLGVNKYGTDWNCPQPGGAKVCVHAFVGKLADGSVATYQTLPWDIQGWHSGYATKWSKTNANKLGYIGFEICEDALKDSTYFSRVYREAVELTAYLCKLYGLDPGKDGVVICHSEGYQRGIASSHSDVMHWFTKFGKNMDIFRADVQAQMNKEEPELTKEEVRTIAREEFNAMLDEMNKLPADSWAEPFIQQGKELGITASGERPRGVLTRQEGIAMAVKAVAAAVAANT